MHDQDKKTNPRAGMRSLTHSISTRPDKSPLHAYNLGLQFLVNSLHKNHSLEKKAHPPGIVNRPVSRPTKQSELKKPDLQLYVSIDNGLGFSL